MSRTDVAIIGARAVVLRRHADRVPAHPGLDHALALAPDPAAGTGGLPADPRDPATDARPAVLGPGVVRDRIPAPPGAPRGAADRRGPPAPSGARPGAAGGGDAHLHHGLQAGPALQRRDRTVFITGAARGIGEHLARAAAARGATVFLAGLEPARLRSLAADLNAAWYQCSDDLPSFRGARRRLPWPLRSTVPVGQCAQALLRGIERRRRRVYVPRAIGGVQAIRTVLNSRPIVHKGESNTGGSWWC